MDRAVDSIVEKLSRCRQTLEQIQPGCTLQRTPGAGNMWPPQALRGLCAKRLLLLDFRAIGLGKKLAGAAAVISCG
jgi:hypothetical protein